MFITEPLERIVLIKLHSFQPALKVKIIKGGREWLWAGVLWRLPWVGMGGGKYGDYGALKLSGNYPGNKAKKSGFRR